MRKPKFLTFLLALVMAFSYMLLCACGSKGGDYTITLNVEKSRVLAVGEEVDFTGYFIVKDKNGKQLVVTESMLDLSNVDLSNPGSFPVTLTVGKSSKTIYFTVKGTSGGETPTPETPGTPEIPEPETFDDVLAKYADMSKWNFAVNLTQIEDGRRFEEYYEYLGYNVLNQYSYYTDYLGYNASTDTYYFYYDNGDGTYDKFAEGTDDFEDCFYELYLVYPSEIAKNSFTYDGEKYVADNPSKAGNEIICEYIDCTWESLSVYIANGYISKIVAVLDDGYTEEHVFSKHGQINFTLPDSSGSGSGSPTTPTGTMEKQTYNSSTFDHDNLQDKMYDFEGAIGLPSTGNVNALVIPVQFVGDTITQSQLNNLELAFNGTSAETGWESVRSYYQKSSYGKLNLTFDIQEVYHAQQNSAYYANFRQNYVEGGYTYTRTGEEIVLQEALSYFENRIDLTKYDTNRDGVIDAVYLIYSAPVDYDDADFYWAYVTWYYGENRYDGLDAYYYLFAGFDFMDESTARDLGSGYDRINGLKINASTFIHETGHLLGLDDYYDYDERSGSNEGLGGADMMDSTVGDLNVYSKIMLGWFEPTIVNGTKTVTITNSATRGDAILVPLNFNNSYFCEYLLIDLYAAQGVNALHASVNDSFLYDGADYGVRIYHVSSSVNDPFNNDYGSFTDYNNSTTKYSLIKLVEADGDRKFSSSGGYASRFDLWLAGDKLSGVFPSYTRNDGKLLNFDIEIVSASASSATITITFN